MASEADSLFEQIDSIKDRGGTDISLGLNHSLKALLEQTPSTHLRRVFLFSDGVSDYKENIPVSTRAIREAGVIVSSFGIGSDFDEAVMKGVATEGGGDYFFISNEASINGLIEKGMRGVERIMATEALLRIVSPHGASIRKVGATPKKDETPGFASFRLEDLRECGMKQVLVELDFDGGSQAGQASPEPSQMVRLISYGLEFLKDGRERMTLEGTYDVTSTLSWAQVADPLNPSVLVQLAIQEVALLDRRSLNLLEQGEVREALRLKQHARRWLERVRDQDQWGFTTALLVRNLERTRDLQGILARRSTYLSATLKKELHYGLVEEDDCDMGFGLFD